MPTFNTMTTRWGSNTACSMQADVDRQTVRQTGEQKDTAAHRQAV